jgi:DNA replication licensing factor MCM6
MPEHQFWLLLIHKWEDMIKVDLIFNVNISTPIMSRFDIYFVIFDDKNDEEDFSIAQHIVNMHRLRDDAVNPEFKMEEL